MAQAMLHLCICCKHDVRPYQKLFYVKAVINGNVESALQVISKVIKYKLKNKLIEYMKFLSILMQPFALFSTSRYHPTPVP